MVILVDGDDHKILLEDINFSGPSFDSIVPGIQKKIQVSSRNFKYVPPDHWVFSGLNGAWFRCQPRKPKSGEHVHSVNI